MPGPFRPGDLTDDGHIVIAANPIEALDEYDLQEINVRSKFDDIVAIQGFVVLKNGKLLAYTRYIRKIELTGL